MSAELDSVLQLTPVATGLKRAFQLPGYIEQDEELKALFEEMVTRLLREADGLPMTTMQYLLVAQISGQFVMMRYRDEHGWEGLGVNAEKDAHTRWLDLVKEWNRLLSSGQDKLREQMELEFAKILTNVIIADNIPDKESLQRVRQALSAELARVGL